MEAEWKAATTEVHMMTISSRSAEQKKKVCAINVLICKAYTQQQNLLKRNEEVKKVTSSSRFTGINAMATYMIIFRCLEISLSLLCDEWKYH